MAEIVDNSQLHLDLYVYEKDLQKLKVGQTIHLHSPTILAKNTMQMFTQSATLLNKTQKPLPFMQQLKATNKG
ncbi:MAG: hypothetical protein IPM42_22395 [Saprospiraceae bacterium]|nr:hypothetical protein [Saprospiraceae bacterium]